jgi:hypothetical protein
MRLIWPTIGLVLAAMLASGGAAAQPDRARLLGETPANALAADGRRWLAYTDVSRTRLIVRDVLTGRARRYRSDCVPRSVSGLRVLVECPAPDAVADGTPRVEARLLRIDTGRSVRLAGQQDGDRYGELGTRWAAGESCAYADGCPPQSIFRVFLNLRTGERRALDPGDDGTVYDLNGSRLRPVRRNAPAVYLRDGLYTVTASGSDHRLVLHTRGRGSTTVSRCLPLCMAPRLAADLLTWNPAGTDVVVVYSVRTHRRKLLRFTDYGGVFPDTPIVAEPFPTAIVVDVPRGGQLSATRLYQLPR